jgi:ParB family chromosome partitioning protein
VIYNYFWSKRQAFSFVILAEFTVKNWSSDMSKDEPNPKDATVRSIPIARISVPKRARKHDVSKVQDLAVSIGDVGLINPISVVRTKSSSDEEFTLVAGGGRLEAAKLLGWKEIAASVLKGGKSKVRRSEISENLFRTDLTALEKAKQISEYADRLEAKGAQHAHPAGRQPHDRGISKAAAKLKISRDRIRRSRAISQLPKATEKSIINAELDDNQAALLKIAATKPEKHRAMIKQLRRRKEARQRPDHIKEKFRGSAVDLNGPDPVETEVNSFTKLKASWNESDRLKTAWKSAPPMERVRFVMQVLRIKKVGRR